MDDPDIVETVPAALAGERVDRAVALITGQPRAAVEALITSGAVRLNDAAVQTRSKRVAEGDLLEVWLPPVEETTVEPDPSITVAVIHADDHIIVVDKPAGLVVHPGSGNWSGTMLNALLHHVPALKDLPRAGIVHRLDKDTSGLLVIAKNEPAQVSLVRQLQARTVKRTYLALARGKVARDGTVEAPIGRHPVQRTKMAVVAGGKPAVTHYRVRQRFPAHTLLECDLETGRTHQIRVHLASIGHPLEGDPAYAGRGKATFGRQALHAWKLAFVHPVSGETLRFESPLPADFRALLASLDA